MKSSGKSILLAAIALASALALTACGSDSGTPTPTPTPTPSPTPIPAAAVSQGVVTAKGSVFVNGIEYSTSPTGTTITVDDVAGSEADLKIGMIVKVRGTSDDATKKGTALKIEARDALEGRIDSVNDLNKTITVMGQIVHIEDNMTRLNDDDLVKIYSPGLYAVNDMVEVHGFADDAGGLRATRVFKKTTGGVFESKGFVTGPTATSFGLSRTQGGTPFITVNFSAPLTAPALNSLVEVKATGAPVAGAITATLIHLEDKLGAAGEKVEVEGLVSSGTLADFVINGQRVVTNASTFFEGGVKADFVLGSKLEAEGPLDASGAIAATKISFRSNIRIEADASTVTATSLTVLGKLVGINKFTRIDNGPIAIGSHVEVRVMPGRDVGTLIATRIIVQNASTRVFLQGPVSAQGSAAGTLTILGFPLVSDGATQWRSSSTSSEVAVTKAEFFAQLKTNTSVVKVRWDNFTATTAPIKEAEIELGK